MPPKRTITAWLLVLTALSAGIPIFIAVFTLWAFTIGFVAGKISNAVWWALSGLVA